MSHREYQYVGPAKIHKIACSQSCGTRINTVSDLITWLSLGLTERTADSNWIATFTISVERILNIAPRRSEHIACSAGNPVLSAGEMTIDGQYRITEISNQSTGFCPE
ncbi:MAG: hypothetical protein F6K09_39800, partial [Merismopedia sp. SIO2A8]|nr:hypothetical protein [Merismopedia sp. SIO2A8]